VNWIWWTGGLLLFGVAALSVYWAFRSPKFIARLTSLASKRVWAAVRPVILNPLPPEKQEEWRKAQRLPDGDKDWRRRRLGLPPKG
jgi:hypothetical protein